MPHPEAARPPTCIQKLGVSFRGPSLGVDRIPLSLEKRALVTLRALHIVLSVSRLERR